MPDSPLGRYGGRPIIKERPKVRDVSGVLYCGRQVQVCNDTINPCIYDQPTYPPSLGDGLSAPHYLSNWIDDESSFHPCAPTEITPPNLPGLPTPSFSGIPVNCKFPPEPEPTWRSGWSTNYDPNTGQPYAVASGNVYSPRGCWKATGSTTYPDPVVIKAEPPKIEYSRIPIDLNMVYEINESEKGYPTQKWTLDPATIASGLGPQPGPSNNPMTIHYPCPIYGRKSIAKICKIKQQASGDLLDMRQFSFRSAPFISTEVVPNPTIHQPGAPYFTNTKAYYYTGLTGGSVTFTFTTGNVLNPVTDLVVKSSTDGSGTYPPGTLPSYLTYNASTQTLTGTAPSDCAVTMEAVNTTTGYTELFTLTIRPGNEPNVGPDPPPHVVQQMGFLPLLNQDFLVYLPTASAVERNTPRAGLNTWYVGNDITIVAPNIVRSKPEYSWWNRAYTLDPFNAVVSGVLLSGPWQYTPDTTTEFTVDIYTTSYTPAGTYDIPLALDLNSVPSPLAPYWDYDTALKAQANTDPDAFRQRVDPGTGQILWEANLIRNYPEISNQILYIPGSVHFDVTKDTCPKPPGKSIRVIDRPDTATNAFDVVGGAPSGSFYSFPDEP